MTEAAKLGLRAEGDLEGLLAARTSTGATVDETIKNLVARIGENMSVRRVTAMTVSPGVVSSYVHNASSPELGKIGVLVALKSTAPEDKLLALGKQLAMHISFAAPLALKPEHLPADVVSRERAIYADQARQSGKPENVIEKMIEGRMRKFYQETVLLAQTYMGPGNDGETTIAKMLEKASKDFGAPVEIEAFVRYQVGEGIEKTDGDFADEVKAMAGH